MHYVPYKKIAQKTTRREKEVENQNKIITIITRRSITMKWLFTGKVSRVKVRAVNSQCTSPVLSFSGFEIQFIFDIYLAFNHFNFFSKTSIIWKKKKIKKISSLNLYNFNFHPIHSSTALTSCLFFVCASASLIIRRRRKGAFKSIA